MDEQVVQTPKKKRINIFDVILFSILTLLVLFVIFISNFWISLSIVDGDSMNQTLVDGDILVTDMLKTPNRSDIVAFKYDEEKNYIKRIVAIEGDVIYNDEEGNVWLKKSGEDTAKILVEDYLEPGTKTKMSFYCELKDGEYFVLGDNRENSQDSRFFGAIKEDQIIGVVRNFWVENKAITTKIFAFRR